MIFLQKMKIMLIQLLLEVDIRAIVILVTNHLLDQVIWKDIIIIATVDNWNYETIHYILPDNMLLLMWKKKWLQHPTKKWFLQQHLRQWVFFFSMCNFLERKKFGNNFCPYSSAKIQCLTLYWFHIKHERRLRMALTFSIVNAI